MGKTFFIGAAVRVVVLITIPLWGLVVCFGAQDQSRQSLNWSTAYWKSIEYSQKGDYKTAITYAEQAVRQAEKEFGKEDHQLTLVLEQLASLYSNQRFYAKAEPLLKRILAIDQKTFGTDHRYTVWRPCTKNKVATLRLSRS
jgi:tetratricopeptide (TPR) repeat protein